jgi:lipopolysaccharide export system protein LptC
VWSSRQSSLTLVFALLGGLAWWLLRHQSGLEVPAPPHARVPDYVVSHFQAIETDATGRPSRRLVAEQMRQFVDEHLAELDLPNLTLYQPEGPPWRAQSRRGLLLAGGDEVRLSEAVRVERAGSRGTRPVRLDTSELTLWPQRQFAEGQRPVRMDSEGDWLSAQGVRLWYATPMRAEFPGRVHAFIAPQDLSEPSHQESTP